MNYKKVTTTALSLLLTVGLAASLVACGGGGNQETAPQESPAESPAPSP